MGKFAIVNFDETKEFVGIARNKQGERYPKFEERQIPHNGKRYKTFANAVGVACDITAEFGKNCFVIETLI